MKQANKISLEFSESELHFLTWAMSYLAGGPFGHETEKERQEAEFKAKKALADLETGIIHSSSNGLLYIACAFCEGNGAYPDTSDNDTVETEPCPVCKGKGQNVFKTVLSNVVKCRFCGGDGKAWDSNGYVTGDVCQVCRGTGIVLLEVPSDNQEKEFIWSLFHPEITRVSRTRFESGHYADSVEAALKEINKLVKDMVRLNTREELDGASLMYKAFSLSQPVIRIGDLSTETGRNIQQGYMQIYAGAMIGIRNPKAHENLVIDSSKAIHLLSLASLLLFKLDERI